jgi:DNA-binding Lrp family transcriptional regulator
MDNIDRKILTTIQASFPLTQRPYRELGNQLKCSEKEILERIKKLKKDGIIRRIGGNFNSRSLGFTTTLCAAKVPDDKIKTFVEFVNRYPGVTHNYAREHQYNIWFTLLVHDGQDIPQYIEQIILNTGVEDIINLPAVRIFKIVIDFALG